MNLTIQIMLYYLILLLLSFSTTIRPWYFQMSDSSRLFNIEFKKNYYNSTVITYYLIFFAKGIYLTQNH